MTTSKVMKTLFIIVDDDEISNLVSRLTIEKTWPDADVITFLKPLEALEFLKNDFMQQKHKHVIMMLNVHMPIITGWEFLDHFELLHEDIKARVLIYILSSSIDTRDEQLSAANKYVRKFISKPLTAEMLSKLRFESNL